MPLVQAKCVNCGAIVEVDSSKEAAICKHCGTPYIVEKAINYYNIHNYNLEKENVNQLVETGYKFLNAQKWEMAYTCFKKAAEDYPSDYRGYWGKFLAKTFNLNSELHCQTEKMSGVKSIYFEDYTNAKILAPVSEKPLIEEKVMAFFDKNRELIPVIEKQMAEQANKELLRKKEQERLEKYNYYKKIYDNIIEEQGFYEKKYEIITSKIMKSYIIIAVMWTVFPFICWFVGQFDSQGIPLLAILYLWIAIVVSIKLSNGKQKLQTERKHIDDTLDQIEKNADSVYEELEKYQK